MTFPLSYARPRDGTAKPQERLAGSVERVTFHSEESGFCVLRMKVRGQRDPVTVVGSVQRLTRVRERLREACAQGPDL